MAAGSVPAVDHLPLRAVLFDFGGVITTSPFEAFARYERERGLPDGFLRSVNATNHHDNAWARLERAEVSLPEFDALFADEAAALGHRVPGADVLQLLMGDVREEMVEALRRIAAADHLVTGLLTNNFIAFGDEDTPGGFRPIVELFDAIIESSQVGVRKPEPRFYELACERLGIEPREAVFLDDLGTNLKTARAMGMRTIKVVDPADALAELEAMLGLPLR